MSEGRSFCPLNERGCCNLNCPGARPSLGTVCQATYGQEIGFKFPGCLLASRTASAPCLPPYSPLWVPDVQTGVSPLLWVQGSKLTPDVPWPRLSLGPLFGWTLRSGTCLVCCPFQLAPCGYLKEQGFLAGSHKKQHWQILKRNWKYSGK